MMTLLKTYLFNTSDFFKTAFHYYHQKLFMKVDLKLLSKYILNNPYGIKSREKKDEIYGETPLTTFELIAKNCQLKESDHLYELGCGRGRTSFWAHFFVRCKVSGFDHTKKFITIANEIVNTYDLQNINFYHENYFNLNFEQATAIYLYGTTLEDIEIQKLIEKFSKLKQGTKIITVSYPLTDYDKNKTFELLNCFMADFPWGKAEIFLQIKK